jgi:ubiquinone biosynthesis protein
VKPRFFFSHAVRAKEIITVLARFGFADLLDHFDLPAGIRRRLTPKSLPGRTTYERIRLALEDLGPTAVKIGQLLSMRPDVLPAGLILELRKLQCEVRPVPYVEIQPLLVAELRAEPDQVFSEFNPVPVASASIAQVYFARLRADNRAVAVKVQRPNIARTIEIDLDYAAWFVGQLHQRVTALQPYDLPSVLIEIRQAMKRELDFGHEARNQQYFNTVNPFLPLVFAPAVVAELSGEKVLVMDWIEGTAADRANLPPEQAKILAAAGARSVVHQILIVGFFHADPHAGNLLVTTDGRLCFLDWGQVGYLTKRLRYALADFWIAAVDEDAERIVQIAISLAPSDVRLEQREMEKEVTLALREELNFALGGQQIGRAMLKLLFICGQQGIMLSRDYSLMAKSVLSIEEIGRALDPAFDLRSEAGPILRQVTEERMSPRTLLRRARDFARASLATLHDLPDELHRLVRRLEHDDFTIKLQHQGLHALDEGMRTAANRIALGVMIGSLIIGSSIIVATHLPPLYHGYSVLGITGYVLSATLGFYVIWDIIRHGRHK